MSESLRAAVPAYHMSFNDSELCASAFDASLLADASEHIAEETAYSTLPIIMTPVATRHSVVGKVVGPSTSHALIVTHC